MHKPLILMNTKQIPIVLVIMLAILTYFSPIACLAQQRTSGVADGKKAFIYAKTSTTQVLVASGEVFVNPDVRKPTEAFLKLIIRNGKESIHLPVESVRGSFSLTKELAKYGTGTWQLSLWSRKEDTSIPIQPKLEGKICEMEGKF